MAFNSFPYQFGGIALWKLRIRKNGLRHILNMDTPKSETWTYRPPHLLTLESDVFFNLVKSRFLALLRNKSSRMSFVIHGLPNHKGQGPLWWFMSDNTNHPSKTLSFRTSPNSEDYIFLSVQCMLKVHHASFQSSNWSFGDMEGVKTKLLSYIALRVVLAHSVRGTKSRDLGSTSWTSPLAGQNFILGRIFLRLRRERLFQEIRMSKYVLKS